MRLTVENLSVSLSGHPVLREVSFTARGGEWWMVTGPNGAGKTTLLRAIARTVAYAGETTLDGHSLRSMRRGALARELGVLSQIHGDAGGQTVEEIVRLGRYARRTGLLFPRDPGEGEAVEAALAAAGLTELRGRRMADLSGGERQRVYLAQVIAQDPRVLLLDEPVNHLDLRHQQQLFQLLRAWLGQGDRLLISVVHDLSLAKKYGTHALLLSEGCPLGAGPLQEVLTDEALNAAWQMDVAGWMRSLAAVWDTPGTQA